MTRVRNWTFVVFAVVMTSAVFVRAEYEPCDIYCFDVGCNITCNIGQNLGPQYCDTMCQGACGGPADFAAETQCEGVVGCTTICRCTTGDLERP